MCAKNTFRCLAALAAISWSAQPLLSGPPFQLDDPDVIPYGHFEYYAFGNVSSSPGEIATSGPAVEFNWSGIRNVMFHFLFPAASSFPSDGPATFGLGDSEIGVQYRFIQETKHRPMVGTFTMMEIPSGNPAKGLGAGKPSWRVPLYAQKTIGSWTIDGGGGEDFSNIAGARNYPFGGTLVLRDVSKKLTLGAELFYHGRQTADPSESRYATMIDFGGYYTIRDPGFQLLFCYGHSVAGQAENYAYLALYWTRAGKGIDGFLARHLPHF